MGWQFRLRIGQQMENCPFQNLYWTESTRGIIGHFCILILIPKGSWPSDHYIFMPGSASDRLTAQAYASKRQKNGCVCFHKHVVRHITAAWRTSAVAGKLFVGSREWQGAKQSRNYIVGRGAVQAWEEGKDGSHGYCLFLSPLLGLKADMGQPGFPLAILLVWIQVALWRLLSFCYPFHGVKGEPQLLWFLH